MATNTIELDPGAAISPQTASAVMGFRANGTPATLDTAEFMTVKPMPKNSDGVQDLDLATKTGIYQVAGNENTKPVNSPLAGTSVYGILEVYQAGVYIMQRFVNVVDKKNAPTYQRIRIGSGGFAPWVLISRGGVNTLYSTNYQLTERKGGRHERDNRPCDRANGHVSFRSVADWIEWLGRDEEDNAVQCANNRLYNGFKRAEDSGELCCILTNVEHSEWRPQLEVDTHRGVLSRRGLVSEDYPVLARGNGYKAVPTEIRKVATLESVHSLLARKEAAV